MANPHLLCVDVSGHELGDLLPRSPMCWNFRCALHHHTWLSVLFIGNLIQTYTGLPLKGSAPTSHDQIKSSELNAE